MSKIDDLIKKYCPNGVEYKKLGDIATVARGGSFQKKDFVEKGFPCIHYGQIYTRYGLFADKTLTFINETVAQKQRMAEPDDIVMAVTSENIEDVCKCVAWLGSGPVAVSGHSAVIHHNQNPKYLSYFFHSSSFFEQKKKIAHGTKVIEVTPSKLLDVIIPVPPLEVQREIVQVLDCFTMLTAELSAELSARKKQYEFYRDQLLSFKKVSPPLTLGWKTLGEICVNICSGGTPSTSHSEYYGGAIPWLRTQEVDWCNIEDTGMKITEKGLANSSAKWIPANCVIVAMYGATAAKVAINKIPLTTNQACCNLEVNENIAIYRYVYHWLCNKYQELKSLGQGSQSNINAATVKSFKIPVPSIDVQKKIVKVLDNFEAICSDLKIGLPAEIELRKKQYEYYRDMLLSFESIGTVLAKQASKQASKQAIISLYQYVYGYAEITLGDIALDMYRGSGITRDQVTNEGIPCVRYGEIYTTYGIHFDKCVSHTNLDNIQNPKYFENGDIIFAITGESIEDIAKCTAYVGKEKCLAGGDTVVMKHEQNAKYLSYALSTTDAVKQKGKGKVKSKVVHSSVPSLAAITIPLPSLAEQERIVAILDRFDALVNDISTGIPAEIEARKKQYEYYRDKLLTFKNIS